MDSPKCSDAWRTINNRIPRCVFFPPNQSWLFSKSASFIPVIAFLAWTKDSFNAATTLALSVVDFSKPFTSNRAGGGVPTNLDRLKLAALTCINTCAKETNVGRRPPGIFFGRNRFSQPREFVFLDHHLRHDFGTVAAEPRCAVLIRIDLSFHRKRRSGGGQQTHEPASKRSTGC